MNVISQRTIYSIIWTFDGIEYFIGIYFSNNGLNRNYRVGYDRHFIIVCKFKETGNYYDLENDIITFKFIKEDARNLNQGDNLTNAWIWTLFRFNFELLIILFIDDLLIKDAAPFIESNID
jgi:hypothetical protein